MKQKPLGDISGDEWAALLIAGRVAMDLPAVNEHIKRHLRTVLIKFPHPLVVTDHELNKTYQVIK